MIISFTAVYDKLKGFNSNCWKPDEMRHNGIIVFKILLSYFNLWFVKGTREDYFYCPSIYKMDCLVHSKNNMWTFSIILKFKKME